VSSTSCVSDAHSAEAVIHADARLDRRTIGCVSVIDNHGSETPLRVVDGTCSEFTAWPIRLDPDLISTLDETVRMSSLRPAQVSASRSGLMDLLAGGHVDEITFRQAIELLRAEDWEALRLLLAGKLCFTTAIAGLWHLLSAIHS